MKTPQEIIKDAIADNDTRTAIVGTTNWIVRQHPVSGAIVKMRISNEPTVKLKISGCPVEGKEGIELTVESRYSKEPLASHFVTQDDIVDDDALAKAQESLSKQLLESIK